MRLEIFDTTLRDGAQMPGIVFSLEDKIQAMRALSRLGVDYIEGGNPASNPKDAALYERLREDNFRAEVLNESQLVAFGATCRVGAVAAEDANIKKMLNCGADAYAIFGKSSLYHVDVVLKTTADENLRMINDTIACLAATGARVFFDAEQFFDGYLFDAEYALETLRTARAAGAYICVLCDTNGGSLPMAVAEMTAKAAALTPVGIHCHNDAGMAVASTLLAVSSGAMHVQGTINGYGERCGNANLCEVLPSIMLKMRHETHVHLDRLTECARTIGEICNMSLPVNAPYVGRAAFAHKAGMHIDGVMKRPNSFEHVEPSRVGNQRDMLISEVAGRRAVKQRMERLFGERLDNDSVSRILAEVKRLESEGYSFEGADASLKLMAMDALGARGDGFRVIDYSVISGKVGDVEDSTRAIVKVRVGEREEITAAEGDGRYMHSTERCAAR